MLLHRRQLIIRIFFFHVKFNLILQLISGISSDLKKLLKYFNGTTIFTFNLLTPAALPATSVTLPNNLFYT